MKRLYGGIYLIMALGLGWGKAQAQEVDMLAGRWVRVSGQGQVSTRPDVAQANVGIRVEGATVAAAMQENKNRMTKILKALKEVGIESRDIATNAFDIHYERPPRKPQEEAEKKGRYWVNNMVRVTIRDLEKVDAVLDGVTAAGANQVWGVQFGLENTQQAAAQARLAAVEQAHAKAKELAHACGAKLGDVLRISETLDNGPGLLRARAVEMDVSAYTSPGEQTFNAQVQIIYALE